VADEVALGDYVVVHVGFAIARIQEDEAHRTLALLREMNALGELEGGGVGSGKWSPPGAEPT
jgi:hydrogenase expression/formation protein HypC